MSEEKTVAQEDVQKALTQLRDIAKGHSSGSTATTKVETMNSESGSTQVFHTPSNSDPKGGWAGSQSREAGENGASDAIDANGTDYNSGAEMVKSILDKLAKGQPVTPEEFEFIKGVAFGKKDDDKDDEKAEKALPFDKDKDKDEKDDKDAACKSLSDHATENETVHDGLEVSEFLSSFTDVMSKALASQEERLTQRIVSATAAEAEKADNMNKALADALANLGEVFAATIQRIDQIESTPARAAKSTGVEAINKSFDGQSDDGERLSKAQVSAALVDLVTSDKLNAQEVIKFDTNGEISEATYNKVLAHTSGK